jgi:WD40 repeat protein
VTYSDACIALYSTNDLTKSVVTAQYSRHTVGEGSLLGFVTFAGSTEDKKEEKVTMESELLRMYDAFVVPHLEQSKPQGFTYFDDGTILQCFWTRYDAEHTFKTVEFKAHNDLVRGLKVYQNNRKMLSWSRDGSIVLWNLNQDGTERSKASIHAHQGGVTALELSPASNTLISAGADDKVRIWDLTHKTQLLSFSVRSKLLKLVIMQPTTHGKPLEKLVTLCEGGEVTAWQIVPTQNLSRMSSGISDTPPVTPGHSSVTPLVNDVEKIELGVFHNLTNGSWIEDNNKLLLIDGGKAVVVTPQWLQTGRTSESKPSLETDELVCRWCREGFTEETNTATSCFASSRHASVANVDDAKQLVYSLEDDEGDENLGGELQQTITNYTVIQQETKLVTFSHKDINIWDLTTATPEAGHKVYHRASNGARLNGGFTLRGDTKLLAWYSDGQIVIWDLYGISLNTITHREATLGVKEVPGSKAAKKFLSWARDGSVLLWDFNEDQLVHYYGHNTPVLGLHFLQKQHPTLLQPDELLVKFAVSWAVGDSNLAVYDLENTDVVSNVRFLTEHSGDILGSVMLDGGRCLSWGQDELVCMWNLENASCVKFRGHSSDHPVSGVLLISDDTFASFSTHGTVIVWHVDKPERDASVVLELGQGFSKIAHMSGTTSFVIACDDQSILVWDYSTKNTDTLHTIHTGTVQEIIPVNQKQFISYCSDCCVVLGSIDALSGEPTVLLKSTGRLSKLSALDPETYQHLIAFDESSNTLVAFRGDRKQAPQQLTLHTDPLDGFAVFDPQRIFSWDSSGVLVLWKQDRDAPDGPMEPLVLQTAGSHLITGVTSLPKINVAVTWGTDVTLWDLNKLKPEAKGHVEPRARLSMQVLGAQTCTGIVVKHSDNQVVSLCVALDNGTVNLLHMSVSA